MNSVELPRDLSHYRVHITGVKGTGCAALTEILAARGAAITGSDVEDVFYTDALLAKLGIRALPFDAANVAGASLVVYSSAYDPAEHPELVQAKRLGIPLVTYTEALGLISAQSYSAGIAGVHGKTTTAGLAGTLLKALALPAQTLAGSVIASFGDSCVMTNGSRYFVAETCEYRRNFLSFRPSVIALTSVESDHQDFFPTYEDIQNAFLDYIDLLPRGSQIPNRRAAGILNQLAGKRRVEIGKPEGVLQNMLTAYLKEHPGWRKSIIDWAKTIVPDDIQDPDNNDVFVSRSSIRDIISHGKGPLKILTIPHLQALLKNGVLYHVETGSDKQGRRERYFNYAHPLSYDNNDWMISITIKEDFNGKRFYDDEFALQVKSADELPNGAGPSTRGSLTHPSALSILRNILAVKPDSNSGPLSLCKSQIPNRRAAGILIYCADDRGAAETAGIAARRRPDIELIPYGEAAQGGKFSFEYEGARDGRQFFRLGGFDAGFFLAVPGKHLALNAACAVAVCYALSRDYGARDEEFFSTGTARKIQEGLSAFTGAKRRSEIIGAATAGASDTVFIDDYGHHPTAVSKTLAGYREFYPGRRLIVDFMPHTFSRTAALFREFAAAFDSADVIILHKIYASAREKDGAAEVTGAALYEEVKKRYAGSAKEVFYFDEPLGALDFCAGLLCAAGENLFVTMGAGDNWKLGYALFERMRNDSAERICEA